MADRDEAARALAPRLNIDHESALEWVDALHAEGLSYDDAVRLADRFAESVRCLAARFLAVGLGMDPDPARRWVDALHEQGLSHDEIIADANALAESIRKVS